MRERGRGRKEGEGGKRKNKVERMKGGGEEGEGREEERMISGRKLLLKNLLFTCSFPMSPLTKVVLPQSLLPITRHRYTDFCLS